MQTRFLMHAAVRIIRNPFMFKESLVQSLKSGSFQSFPRSFVSLRAFATVRAQSDSRIKAERLMAEGSNLLIMGDTESAMQAYQQALVLYPSATCHYNIGNLYFQLGTVDIS